MDLAELEAKTSAKAKEVEDFPDEDGEEILMEQDIIEALGFLTKSMHLLDYLGDVELCKSISKRERESMTRFSNSIKAFLDDVEPHYAEEE